jgi:hypothetical protein
MEASSRRKRRVRIRVRNRRAVRLVLLCLGLVGLVLGMGMLGGARLTGNPKLLTLGVVYILAAGAVLAARQAITAMSDMRRERGQRQPASQTEEDPACDPAARE